MKTYTFSTGMTVTRDYNRDGYLVIENAKTIELYKQIQRESEQFSHPGFTFAFGDDQIENAKRRLIPQLKEGEKLIPGKYGMIATPEGYKAWIETCTRVDERIKNECDPQEVYCYEYNNYESFISWEGDEKPYNIVRSIFGYDVKLHRFTR